MPDKIDPPTNALVAALVDETGTPVSVRCLEGYLGPTVGGMRRLYLELDMQSAAEFPAAALRFHCRYRPADSAVKKDVVWVLRAAVSWWSRQAPTGALHAEKGGGGGPGYGPNFR